MKKIKFVKNIKFIDNYNSTIYWFTKITDDSFYGYSFKKNGRMEKGEYDRLEWEKMIKLHKVERFNEVDLNSLSIKRKHNMIKSIYGTKPEKGYHVF